MYNNWHKFTHVKRSKLDSGQVTTILTIIVQNTTKSCPVSTSGVLPTNLSSPAAPRLQATVYLPSHCASHRSSWEECNGTPAVCSLPSLLPHNSPTLPPIWIKISLPGHHNTQCPERTGTGNRCISLNYTTAKVNRLQSPRAIHWTGKGGHGLLGSSSCGFSISWHISEFVWRAVSHFHC